MSRSKNIDIPILARVEGEGALHLTVKDDQIEKLHLRIYEPPRLFEQFLVGREPNEVIDAVARICGICPVAYQMSAVQALESIFHIQPDAWVHAMRRVFYCGEWMESHAIHIHMLAAPDFLGFNSAIAMAKQHPEAVKRGMALHALGVELMSLLGKRSINPVGACVGGFYHAPTLSEVEAMLTKLEAALPQAEALVQWTATLPLPDNQQDFTCVAMRHPDEYPMNLGRLVSNRGLDIAISEFEQHFQESHVPHSTALHCHLDGEPYMVGPLARLNLNFDILPDSVKQVIANAGIRFPSQNMFHSIVARAVEIYYSMVEAIRLLRAYTIPASSFAPMTPRAGVGYGCTEAPRGILWQRYETDAQGLVVASRIVPPTSQNQARIEADIRHTLMQSGLDRSAQDLRLQSEMVIRNYDPCISCSTHFLTLDLKRR